MKTRIITAVILLPLLLLVVLVLVALDKAQLPASLVKLLDSFILVVEAEVGTELLPITLLERAATLVVDMVDMLVET